MSTPTPSSHGRDLQQTAFVWLDAFAGVIDDTRAVFRLERRIAARSVTIVLAAVACVLALLSVTGVTLAFALGWWLFVVTDSAPAAFVGVLALTLSALWLAVKRLVSYAGNLKFTATRQALVKAHG